MPTPQDLFELPQKLKGLLGFIEAYWIEHGYSPTYREMAKALGISVNAVRRRCKILEDSDFVRVVEIMEKGEESRERRLRIPNIPGRDYRYRIRQVRRKNLINPPIER